MKKTFVTICAITTLSFSSASMANTVVCSGTVQYLSFQANNSGSGVLMIRLSSMNTPVYFCDPAAAWSASGGYQILPEASKALYATFLSAKATGATIQSMYFDGDQAPPSCDAWATWASANIRYYVYGP